jgi:hypothetical protein
MSKAKMRAAAGGITCSKYIPIFSISSFCLSDSIMLPRIMKFFWFCKCRTNGTKDKGEDRKRTKAERQMVKGQKIRQMASSCIIL